MSRDLLFEIGVEELPSTYIEPALEQLKDGVWNGLMQLRLVDPDARIDSYATPRRLAVVVKGVFEAQYADAAMTHLGPPLSACYDASGEPTPALLGFCRKLGMPLDAIEQSADGKRVTLTKALPSLGASAVVPGMLASVATKLQFPKSMRWDDGDYRFGRPVRWLLALLGQEVLPVSAFGLEAGRITYGHRFMHPGAVEIAAPSHYLNALRDADVIADHRERRELVKQAIIRAATKLRGGVRAQVIADEDLVEINTFLVERPAAFEGQIDSKYFVMPNEVLIMAMREHQRFFAVGFDGDPGHLVGFVAVRNGDERGFDVIRKGSQEVLIARLEDALFYWNTDSKHPPAELVDKLSGVVWMEGLGSLREKAARLVSLAGWLSDRLAPGAKSAATRAALLCKTDLLGEMIGSGKEYASLEGIMGSYYAIDHGESQEVGEAIYEHYLPRGAGDALPESDAGSLLSLADKLDHVAGAFVAGKIPSGSEDPYGVRRAANGAVRIVLEQRRPLDLRAASMEMTRAFFAADPELAQAEIMKKLGEFWRGRVDTALDDRGVAYDTRDAALEARILMDGVARPGWCDAADAFARAQALGAFRGDPRFEPLVVLYKRVANILKAAEGPLPATLDRAKLGEAAEQGLLAALDGATQATAPLWERKAYAELLPALLALEQPIHTFFEKVMVNVDDPVLRGNRLQLLADVRDLFMRGWDLSKIVVEGEKG